MLTTAVATALTITVCLAYLRSALKNEERSRTVMDGARDAGLTEPPSLHPVIDPARCLGCGSCIAACPENQVLGLVEGKSRLINPTHCIGHGACKSACPEDAITLVFGTETRGVDIPLVKATFETNVPGIYIAGELGGMGLIRNAIEQGKQAVESIRKRPGIGSGPPLDLVIVGAGPAGLAASLAAKQHGLRFVTLEQDSLGGTVAHYPRGKIVMTAPAELPLVGRVRFTETTKEELLGFWQGVEQKTGLQINYGERLEDVAAADHGLTVTTTRGTYSTRNVLLAIGRRGTPRKLGVPGEDLNKVVYRLIDPEQYRGRHVLVVGGGDSALEAAATLADAPGTTVTLSYRSAAFSRAREKNRVRVEQAATRGSLELLLKSSVKQIEPEHVHIDHEGGAKRVRNDAVIVAAGGILPTPFLKKLGIEVETKFGKV